MSATERLAEYVNNQPEVAAADLQPRNKVGLIATSSNATAVREALGRTYNAHKIRLFAPPQLKEMYEKIKYVNINGCYQCTNTQRAEPATTSAASPSPKKVRGMEPTAAMKRAGIPDGSYEVTHIVLGFNGVYPPTSEHEVSHRCHNPACVRFEHLLWEFHRANVDREQCRYSRNVTCPKCEHVFTLCKHEPPCL